MNLRILLHISLMYQNFKCLLLHGIPHKGQRITFCYFSVCFQQLQRTEVTTNHGQLMPNALLQSRLKTPGVTLQVNLICTFFPQMRVYHITTWQDYHLTGLPANGPCVEQPQHQSQKDRNFKTHCALIQSRKQECQWSLKMVVFWLHARAIVKQLSTA